MPLLPDLVPARATRVIGGPPGRHTNPSGWWLHLAVRVVPLLSLPMVLAVVQRQHCVRYGWAGSDQFWRACFSDLPAQYALGNLDRGLGGYLSGEASVEQPVIAGSVMALLGGLVPEGSALEQSRFTMLYWIALITLLLALTVWCTIQLVPTDLGAAAQVALSPVIALAAVLSSDALAVALVAAAMVAWHRDKVVLTGILLGFGVMSRSYVVLVALALLMLATRRGVIAEVARALAVAAVTIAGIAAVFAALAPDALIAAYTAWWRAEAGYGSLWLIPSIAGAPLPAWAVSALAIAGWGLALLLGWILVREAERTPTWPQVALVVVAVALMTGKAVPVQAALWLLPLAAAAGMRWRDHLIWAACESAHFVAVWLYVGALTTPDRALPGPWYAVSVLIRMAGVAWLVTRIWQETRGIPIPVRPEPEAPATAPSDPDEHAIEERSAAAAAERGA